MKTRDSSGAPRDAGATATALSLSLPLSVAVEGDEDDGEDEGERGGESGEGTVEVGVGVGADDDGDVFDAGSADDNGGELENLRRWVRQHGARRLASPDLSLSFDPRAEKPTLGRRIRSQIATMESSNCLPRSRAAKNEGTLSMGSRSTSKKRNLFFFRF